MPFERLCFIHAANLALDHQLQGTGPLPEEIRRLVEESTLTAFEKVVSTCIDEGVDFLLLTGNSFVEQDRSLRARVALLRAFEELAEHDIRVFVMPGSDDPVDAWQAMGSLPDNVTTFFNGPGEPVAVIRDAKVIASVSGGISSEVVADGQSTNDPSISFGSRRTAFTIGLPTPDQNAEIENLFGGEPGHVESEQADPTTQASDRNRLSTFLSKCPVDYVAIGGGGTRKVVALDAGVAHRPGATQGLRPSETGSHGCTLISVDPDGRLKSTFISTAPVRWEWFEVRIDADANRDELAEMMRSALGECRPEASEKVYLVNWSIHGSGPLFESLQDEAVRKELIDSCAQNAWCDGELSLQHVFRFLPDGESTADDPLLAEYSELLAGEQPASGEIPEPCLQKAALPDTEWSGHLQDFAGDLNHAAVIGHARRLGATWLAANSEEESES